LDSPLRARHAIAVHATSVVMAPLLWFRRCTFAALFCAGALLLATDAGALQIALGEQHRSVASEASASTAAAADSDADSDATLSPGLASLAADATASVAPSAATAASSQAGDIATLQLTGTGAVSSDAAAPTADAFSFASAEARLRIGFVATADSLVRLLGRVDATGSGAGDASALLELSAVDSTLDPLLLLFEAGPGESFDVDVIAALQTGVAYRLLALARTGSDALDGESGANFGASFRFALTEVPEPSTALAVALGLALLAERRTPVPA
jgi:hypothetical protein